ncbi:hypothetical protein T03_4920, partial [Trichinella britovi]
LASSGETTTLNHGHSLSGCRNQSGPFHHKWSFRSLSNVQPRLSRSAGLSAVGTYLHWLGSVSVIISCTRFATNVFHFRGSPLVQLRATELSLQQTCLSVEKPISFVMYAFNRAASKDAINSKRGRLRRLMGATRALARTKRT